MTVFSMVLLAVGQALAAAPSAAPGAQELSPVSAEPIGLVAREVTAWREGDAWCYLLKGDARAVQGQRTILADALVVWFDEAQARQSGVSEIHLYGSGKALLHLEEAVLEREEAFARWRTRGRLDVEALGRRRLERRAGDPLFLRAETIRRQALLGAVQEEKVQRELQPDEQPLPLLNVYPLTPGRLQMRSVAPPPGTTERITIFTGGLDVVYRDPLKGQEVEIAADNLVLWSREKSGDRLDTPATLAEGPAAPGTERVEYEVYAEGNVTVFALGGTLRAPRVFYNLTTNQALLTDVRVESYSKARKVPLIYKAARVRQFAQGLLTASDAALTSCTFGVPHFDIASRRVTLTEQPVTDARGRPVLDEKGRPVEQQVATMWENTLWIGGVPFFYWPYTEHDLTKPETAFKRLRLRKDGTFGYQALSEWDLWFLVSGILGAAPTGSDATLRLDYMSERGVAGGVNLEYAQADYLGYARSYGLRDQGLDHGDFEPPTRDRGRFLWRHHHDLAPDTILKAEVSLITDEAFLNEFFEEEFREDKEQETVLYLKKQEELWAATFLTKVRVNDWQSETDYLPRVALHVLGVPLADDTMTFISRSELGGVRMVHGDPERVDLAPIPEAQEATIFRAETRNELHRPFTWWIFRVDPFVQTRWGYFSESAGDLATVPRVLPDGTVALETVRGDTQGAEGRVSLAAGGRASTQFWRVYPDVQSDFWNVDGLRHIITPQIAYFDLFLLNVDSEELVQFDEVDAVDKVRVVEILLRQRLQTHRGVGEKRRVVDWVTLDLRTAVFPDAGRDNEGETLADVTANLEWRLTDVVSVVSAAEYDTQEGQLGTFSVGAALDQTPRYSLFVGQRFINASDTNATVASLAYQVSEKWRVDLQTAYDWGGEGLLQNRLRFQRDLHDFYLTFGVGQDRYRNNTGIFLELVPKGLPELGLRLR